MYIRCWGSRGSIPVSGKDYLKYGGDTTCMEIRACSGELIVVDAGTGIRCLGHKLIKNKTKKFDMLFTHAHWDHLIGFPFFAPVYTRGCKINIWAPTCDKQPFRDVMAGFMRCPYFPVSLDDKDVRAELNFKKINDRSFSIGKMSIKPVPLSHPKNGGKGFCFEDHGKKFVFLTDNELGHVHSGGLEFDEYVEICRGADLLIHDAEYDNKDYKLQKYWGHSVFEDAVKLGLEAGVKKLGLFHINNRRTDEQLDGMVERARKIIVRRKGDMECFAVGSTFETKL